MEVEENYPTKNEIMASGPYQCDDCGAIVSHAQALRLHRVQVHKIIKNQADQRLQNSSFPAVREKPTKTKRFYCCDPKCRSTNRFFGHMKLLKQHYQKCHVTKSLICEQCSKIFSLERDLAYHVKHKCKGITQQSPKENRKCNEFTIKVTNDGKMLHFSGPMPDEGYSLMIRRSGSHGVHVEVVPNLSMSQQDVLMRSLTSTQTDITCITQETEAESMFMCQQEPSTSAWEADYIRQDVFCQTAASSIATTNDFGTQIDPGFAQDYSRQMRHVETTMDLPNLAGDEGRSIETQTIWTNQNQDYYQWFHEDIEPTPGRSDANGNSNL